MRHLSTCCAAAPKLSHPPLCELPLKSAPTHSPPPFLIIVRPTAHPTQSPFHSILTMYVPIHHCAAKCLLELWTVGRLFLSLSLSCVLPHTLSLSRSLCSLRPRISRANCDELLIVLCASSRNALFIFNHRTNTGRRPENMARHLFDDMCKQLAH